MDFIKPICFYIHEHIHIAVIYTCLFFGIEIGISLDKGFCGGGILCYNLASSLLVFSNLRAQ